MKNEKWQKATQVRPMHWSWDGHLSKKEYPPPLRYNFKVSIDAMQMTYRCSALTPSIKNKCPGNMPRTQVMRPASHAMNKAP